MGHTPKELVKAAAEGNLYDYIANHYYEMTLFEMKEILLAVLGVGLDNCHTRDGEEAYAKQIVEELGNRFYGEE